MEAADPYLIAATGVLRNLVGATTKEALRRAEGDLATARMIQVQDEQLVEPSRDLNEVCSLHRHLFQDIYDWAGDTREIDFRRGDGLPFAGWQGIQTLAFNMFQELSEQDFLKGLPFGGFVERMAYFYEGLNFIHPFREGNGRTQRLFWSRVAFDAGWILDWRPIHGEELDEVSRVAREDSEQAPLVAALSRCVSARTTPRA